MITLSAWFAWAVLHSLWQFAAAWLFNAAVQRLCRRRSARLRYLAACGFYFGAAAAGIGTAVFLASGDAGIQFRSTTNGLTDLLQLTEPPAWLASVTAAMRAASPLLAWIWSAVTIRNAVVYGRRAWNVSSLMTRARLLRPDELPAIWWQLKDATVPYASVYLAESPAVDGPLTAGWINNLIIVPIGFFAQMSPTTVRAVLAHELNHLRMQDHWVELAQVAVECLFWFHPLINSFRQQIYELREMCCDGLAAETHGDEAGYVDGMMQLCGYHVMPLARGATGTPVGRRMIDLLQRRPSGKLAAAQLTLLAAALIGSIGLTSRTVAAKIAYRTDIAASAAERLSACVCDVLGASDNPAFVGAVEDAVVAMQAGRLDGKALAAFVRVAAKGSTPDALLKASYRSYSAGSLSPTPAAGWRGGNHRDWGRLAYMLYAAARDMPPGERRTEYARASVALAAQERIVSGGIITRLVREPDFQAVAAIPPAACNRLLTAISLQADRDGAIGLAIDQLVTDGGQFINAPLRKAVGESYSSQWRLANRLATLQKKDPARAVMLIASVRAGSDLWFSSYLLSSGQAFASARAESSINSNSAPTHGGSDFVNVSGGSSK